MVSQEPAKLSCVLSAVWVRVPVPPPVVSSMGRGREGWKRKRITSITILETLWARAVTGRPAPSSDRCFNKYRSFHQGKWEIKIAEQRICLSRTGTCLRFRLVVSMPKIPGAITTICWLPFTGLEIGWTSNRYKKIFWWRMGINLIPNMQVSHSGWLERSCKPSAYARVGSNPTTCSSSICLFSSAWKSSWLLISWSWVQIPQRAPGADV